MLLSHASIFYRLKIIDACTELREFFMAFLVAWRQIKDQKLFNVARDYLNQTTIKCYVILHELIQNFFGKHLPIFICTGIHHSHIHIIRIRAVVIGFVGFREESWISVQIALIAIVWLATVRRLHWFGIAKTVLILNIPTASFLPWSAMPVMHFSILVLELAM